MALFDMKNKLILDYNYSRLKVLDNLYVSRKLLANEINNLEYLNDNAILEFNLSSLDSLSEVVETLKKLGKNNKILINVGNNKNKLNNYLFSNKFDYSNIFVKTKDGEYSLVEYLKVEEKLYNMLEGISELSPFEKYIYAYNVCKKFKKYSENSDNKKVARNLYDVLNSDNDFIVCVGFSKIFGELLDKLGIANYDLRVIVDVSYSGNNDNTDEVKVVEYNGHDRRYVHIIDEKYGIDGFYVADPTWDNNLDYDFYNHLVMTDREVLDSKRYLKLYSSGVLELFNVISIDEYIEKINFLISRENADNNINGIMNDLINILRKLDNEYVNTLLGKYEFIKLSIWDWPKDIESLVYDIGEYLIEHVNKEISGEVIIDAVRVVYEKVYGYSGIKLDNEINRIININKKRQEKMFPVRYNILDDGSKEVYYDVENKFDMKNNERSM